ncbi:MAG: hypothetical protein GY940_40095 [bacterium]|nr:hypothetical protein [bacterium]
MNTKRRISYLKSFVIVLLIGLFAGHDGVIFNLEASGSGQSKRIKRKSLKVKKKNIASLLKLTDDSLLQTKLKYQKPIASGAFSMFKGRKVMISKDFSQSLGEINRIVLADHNAFRGQMARFRGVARRLGRTIDNAYEFNGSYVLVRSTKVIVTDPGRFSRTSPAYKNFISAKKRRKGTGKALLASLDPESRKGLEAFIKKDIPRMAENHPLRIASKKSKGALLKAIADGEGLFEIVDTLVIPKKTLPVKDGKFQKPTFKNGFFDHNKLKSLTSPRLESIINPKLYKQLVVKDLSRFAGKFPTKAIDKPGTTQTGTETLVAKFLAGFTRGKSWEWERRWNYTSGFFRVTLGASYGIGLRIPIKATGVLTPSLIEVKDTRDRHTPMHGRVHAEVLNANSAFYRDTGLPQSKVFDGKEAVLEVEFGYGYKLRALWKTLKHKRYTTYGFNYSKHFTPPFGSNQNAGYRFEIPPSLTRTELNFTVIKGYAQAGLKLGGRGEVQLDYEAIQDGVGKGKKVLTLWDSRSQQIRNNLSLINPPGNQVRKSSRYGFKLSNPRYNIDLTLTPEVKIGVNIGYRWLSRSFNTGWISLNAFRLNLGKVGFGRHSGTRSTYTLNKGIKRFEKIANYQGTGGDIVAIQCLRNGKYVKAERVANNYLAAVSGTIVQQAKFRVIDLGNDRIALKSQWNGKYVRAGIGRDSMLGAVSSNISTWETFIKVSLPNGQTAFKSVQSLKYVRAGVGSETRLAASSNSVGSWERFKLWPAR